MSISACICGTKRVRGNSQKPGSKPAGCQFFDLTGAGTGIRTSDLLITNEMLYQLSYAGALKGGQYMQITPL